MHRAIAAGLGSKRVL